MVISPARTFKFRMKWEGNCVVGVSKMGNLMPICASHGTVNWQAVNLLRQFNILGDLMSNVRTIDGDDNVVSKPTVPISHLALFIESSLYVKTRWVVFEPNTPSLWGRIGLNVGAFMQGLFFQGAFHGRTHKHAHFVKCDSENNPQPSIDRGIVNMLVGFAPLYPSEFVVIPIQQIGRPASGCPRRR
jgi:uncharacterized protein